MTRVCQNNNLQCPHAVSHTGVIGTACVFQQWCAYQLPQDLCASQYMQRHDIDLQRRFDEFERLTKTRCEVDEFVPMNGNINFTQINTQRISEQEARTP